MAEVKIVLFGKLGHRSGRGMSVPVADGTLLRDMMASLDVPSEQVQMVMVNHRAVSGEYPLRAGDRVALFPDDYVIFADWAGYRRKTVGHT